MKDDFGRLLWLTRCLSRVNAMKRRGEISYAMQITLLRWLLAEYAWMRGETP